MLRILQTFLILFFTVSVVLFCFSFREKSKASDSQGPVIHMDRDRIEISVKDDVSAILNGITASDSKDGDVSNTLVVESLSNFIEKGRRQAVIAAFDQDNHVTKMTRDVIYADYRPPHFTLKEPLRFSVTGHESIIENLTAYDVLDGDITDRITLRQNDADTIYTDLNPGNYPYMISVVNSAGDGVLLPVTVELYTPAQDNQCPKAVLSDYLIYIKTGTKFQPAKYISGIRFGGRTWPIDHLPEDAPYTEEDIHISNHADTNVPGTYEILYTMENETQDQSRIRLIVVVEE